MRCTLVALLTLAFAPAFARAADTKPAGTWKHKSAEMKLAFEKDVLKLYPHGDKDVIVLVCKFTADKNGVIKAKITDFEGKEEFQEQVKKLFPAGFEFTFKLTVQKDNATLDDVQGKDTEGLKSRLEGEYEKKD